MNHKYVGAKQPIIIIDNFHLLIDYDIKIAQNLINEA